MESDVPINTISVFGLGYIGLPTAAAFAARKTRVIGIDVNQNTVDTINRGEIHIVEPELDMIVKAAVTQGYLTASTEAEPADAFLIAVPTPFRGDDHKPDLSYIKAASHAIAKVLKKGDLVILESTSPVGATEKVVEWMSELRPDLAFPSSEKSADIYVAHCPERVLPGHVMRELVENDRVIGGISRACSEKAIELYKIFVQGECVITNARTAEMAKLTENASRDVNIAFANELSIICDELGINVWELIKLANRHPRVNILQPGPGVGGHCIAVDPWFIVSKTPSSAKLIKQARLVNDSKPSWVVAKIVDEVNKCLHENPKYSVEDVTLAIYGLTFKANIDDLRESPALQIASALQSSLGNCRLVAVEPNISTLPSDINRFELLPFEDARRIANVHVILVNHKEFSFDSGELSSAYLVDTQGLASPFYCDR